MFGYSTEPPETPETKYKRLIVTLKERAKGGGYTTDAAAWHQAANKAQPFDPGLAAVLRDVAYAFEVLSTRVAGIG